MNKISGTAGRRTCRRLMCALALSGVASSGWTQDTAHGRLLYETYCGGCHYEKLHDRPRSRTLVKSRAELTAQVMRWAPQTKHSFTNVEIEEVVNYLNRSHYKLAK